MEIRDEFYTSDQMKELFQCGDRTLARHEDKGLPVCRIGNRSTPTDAEEAAWEATWTYWMYHRSMDGQLSSEELHRAARYSVWINKKLPPEAQTSNLKCQRERVRFMIACANWRP